MLNVESFKSWKSEIRLRMSCGELLSGVADTRMTFLAATVPQYAR